MNRSPENMTVFSLKIMSPIFLVLLLFCHFPYTPEPEPEPLVNNMLQGATGIKVYSIAGTNQTCNPSVSLDTGTFPGCMLWLNFSGELMVNIPDSLSEYAGRSSQHDRLTIIDTSNTVRWFMKREELGASALEEFQDPEWSAHPELIVCLLSDDARTKWGSYIIHPRTRAFLKICNGGLDETSTPHLWVRTFTPPEQKTSEVSYDDDAFADSASVSRFFGTNKVKFIAAKKVSGILSLYLKDYASGSGFIPLKRPVDREGWNCESPLISSDGNWIAFNAFKYEDFYEVYIQELTPDAVPILFASGASDPHWWVHPRDTSLHGLVYQEVPGWNLVEGDLSEEKYQQTAELGITYRQYVRLFEHSSTASTALMKMGTRDTLVTLPTKGGLSPDGRFLCTGYERAFIVGLP